MRLTYLSLNETINNLNFYKSELKNNETNMKEKQQDINNIENKDNEAYLDIEIKQSFLNMEINYSKELIEYGKLLKIQIKDLEEYIASLQLIIQFIKLF